MSPRPHYQVEKAVVALQRLVSEGSLSPGSRLPSIAGLAKAAGVSKLTMWKAVSRLKDLGEFAGEPGKRIYVSRGSSQEYSLPPASGAADAYRDIPPSQKWQKVKSRILNDILNGSIRRDAPLPGFKEMQYRYGISFRTLKKSLDQLCHEKILEPSKRGYSVVTHGQDLSHVRVIYLAPSSRSGGIVRNLYVHMLEEISAQRRVNLEVQSFEPLQEPPQFRKYGTDKNVSPYNRDDALGYILLVTGLAGISDDLLSRLSAAKKPVAILDEIGGLSIAGRFEHIPSVLRFTSSATETPGVKVARYLLDKGHRRAVYISPFHHAVWSTLRLRGLVQTYDAAGYAGNVTALTLDEPDNIWDFQADAMRNAHAGSLLAHYNSWKVSLDQEFTDITDKRMRQIVHDMCFGEVNKRLKPLFEKALEIEGVTAWVCANDTTAVKALAFLKESKIAVPDSIAVISFDDTPDAVESRLTSYNFNMRALFDGIFDFLTGVPLPGRKNPRVVEGFIVRRDTA